MDNIVYVFIGLSIFIVVATTVFFIRRLKKIALEDFVLPDLKLNNCTLISLKTLPGQFLGFPFKQKGNWENEIAELFSDTKFNAKIYFQLIYRDANGLKQYTTVKIHTDFISTPIKAEYLPEINKN